ncbi:MAG TPA: hypothetical protein ENH80_13165, partial [Phycisphaerae bacterium]|nr:hypothetical protein [Phycisphaerae bacterium]
MIERKDNSPQDSSYTAAAGHSTAAALGKDYRHDFVRSADEVKDFDRHSDGHLSSGAYARASERLADSTTPKVFQIDYHHPLENWLGTWPMRWLLGRISRPKRDGTTALQRIFESYRNSEASFWQRLIYATQLRRGGDHAHPAGLHLLVENRQQLLPLGGLFPFCTYNCGPVATASATCPASSPTDGDNRSGRPSAWWSRP